MLGLFLLNGPQREDVVTLAADSAFRGYTLDADPLRNSYSAWVNDPITSPLVGQYQSWEPPPGSMVLYFPAADFSDPRNISIVSVI